MDMALVMAAASVEVLNYSKKSLNQKWAHTRSMAFVLIQFISLNFCHKIPLDFPMIVQVYKSLPTLRHHRRRQGMCTRSVLELSFRRQSFPWIRNERQIERTRIIRHSLIVVACCTIESLIWILSVNFKHNYFEPFLDSTWFVDMQNNRLNDHDWKVLSWYDCTCSCIVICTVFSDCRDVKVAAQSSSTILVSWKAPIGSIDQAIIGYYVGYKLSSFSGPFAYKTVEALNKINHLEEHCLLTGLRKNSRYEITVQSFNSKGTGPPSDHIEIQTLEFGKN